MRRFHILRASLVALAALAAGLMSVGWFSSEAGDPATAPDPPARWVQTESSGDPAGAMCPMTVGETSVSVADTATGTSLVFRTASEDEVVLANLRQRVVHMAEMHRQHLEAHAGEGGMMGEEHEHNGMMGGEHGGMMGSDREHGGRMMMMHRGPMATATVTAEEVEGGARLVFEPSDPSQLDALRLAIHEHSEQMNATGGCSMMEAGSDEPESAPEDVPEGHDEHH